MEIELKPGERLDDLQRKGYRIIQDPGCDLIKVYSFGRLKSIKVS